VLDLGTFAPDPHFELSFAFILNADTNGSGFGFDFLFGAPSSEPIVLPPGAGGPGGGGGTEVPVPGTLALLGFAGAALVVRKGPCACRRRADAARVGGACSPAEMGEIEGSTIGRSRPSKD
jgi:hypothetical protein